MQTQEHTGSAPAIFSDFDLTEAAAERINYLKSKEGSASVRFRVSVKGGGCSGFQYEFDLDHGAPNDDDTVITKNGAQAVVDEVSLGLLKGSVLDYSEDLAQAGFTIKNPNATAKCGCGNSFSITL